MSKNSNEDRVKAQKTDAACIFIDQEDSKRKR